MAAATSVPNPTSAQLLAYVQAHGHLGSNSMLDADQWNYYYSNLTGVQQTANLFPAGNRTALMNVAQYFQARATAGLPAGGTPPAATTPTAANPGPAPLQGLAGNNSASPTPTPVSNVTVPPNTSSATVQPAATAGPFDFFSSPVQLPLIGTITTGMAMVYAVIALAVLWLVLEPQK